MTWTPPEPAIVNTEECELYYTLDQLLAVRRETIEECAALCEKRMTGANELMDSVREGDARAIRKLGEQT